MVLRSLLSAQFQGSVCGGKLRFPACPSYSRTSQAVPRPVAHHGRPHFIPTSKALGQKKKPRNHCSSEVFHLAAGEGFEPSHTESESAVLPLHNPARSVRCCSPQRTDIIIHKGRFLSTGFPKIFHYFLKLQPSPKGQRRRRSLAAHSRASLYCCSPACSYSFAARSRSFATPFPCS